MSVSMYKLSVPIFTQMLTALSNVLDKSAAHAAEKKIDLAFLANMRLYPDMFNLIRQVQQATSHAVRMAAALANVPAPEIKNVETKYEELKPRIAKAIDFLNTLKPEQFEGSENRAVTIGERTMPGRQFLLTQTYPQVFFHCTTAYDILRHCGVPLTKADFIGQRADI
jgi:hypothetical protein